MKSLQISYIPSLSTCQPVNLSTYSYHFHAGISTFAANLSTMFTMLHMGMLFTFFSTGITNLSTTFIKPFSEFASPAHQFGCCPADCSTIKIQLNTFFQFLHMLLF